MKGDIEILICQLRDGRSGTRIQAARSLAGHPTPLARKDLVRCLSDTHDEVRYWATLALSMLDDERLGGRIAAQLDDPARQVRMIAAKVLSEKPYRGALPSLLANLGDEYEDVAYWAGQALVALGDYALPQLVCTLGDESWKRREGAAGVLERIGSPVIPHLVRALTRDDANIRYWTLKLLGNLRAFNTTTELARFLASEDRDLVKAAAEALGAMGDRRAIPELILRLSHPDEGVRTAVIAALSHFPDEAVHELTRLLDSNRRVTRLSSSLALAAAGDVSLKPLLDRLAEDSAETRYWVIQALAQLENPVVIPVLEELLDDESTGVQRASARALGAFRLEADTAERLVDRLDSEDWLVRQAVADCLSRQGHLPVAVYEKPLASGSEHQRYWITKILGAYRTPEVVPLLLSRFSDSSWPIRKNAADSISMLGPVATPSLLERLSVPNLDADLKYWTTRAMIGLDDPCLVSKLTELLADPDLTIRENARLALESHGSRTVSSLLEALRLAGTRAQREGISLVLARIGSDQVEQIASLLKFRDPEVNYWATRTLSGMGVPAERVLVKLMAEPDQRIRYQALQALGFMDSRGAVEASMEALDDEYSSVRRLAIENLGKLKAKQAVGPLVALMEKADADLVCEILGALGEIGATEAAEAVATFASHERWEIQRAAILALGRIGGEVAKRVLPQRLQQEHSSELIVLLIRALGDAGVREAAGELTRFLSKGDDLTIEALSTLARLEALPSQDDILSLLSSPSWRIRRAALAALARLGASFDLARLKPILAGDDLLLKHEAWATLRAVMGEQRWGDLQRLTVEKSLREPAEQFFGQACELARAKRPEEALALLRKALRLSKRPEYFALQGSIHLELRNVNQAVRSLRRAMADRSDPVSACKLAMAHFIGKDLRRALAAFRKVLGMPGCPESVTRLARSSIEKIQEQLKDKEPEADLEPIPKTLA